MSGRIDWGEIDRERMRDLPGAEPITAASDRLARHRDVLTALVEAVGRGDEVGLPEAYRAARVLLTDGGNDSEDPR